MFQKTEVPGSELARVLLGGWNFRSRKQTALGAKRPDITECQDTSAPGHFGTKTVRHQTTGAKCPDTSAPIFFGAELSHGHFGLVPNCLGAEVS